MEPTFKNGGSKSMFGKIEELLVVLVIILILFGAKKLPQLARSIGESVREVRKGFNGEEAAVKKTAKTESDDKKAA